jgi:hypothetical protein
VVCLVYQLMLGSLKLRLYKEHMTGGGYKALILMDDDWLIRGWHYISFWHAILGRDKASLSVFNGRGIGLELELLVLIVGTIVMSIASEVAVPEECNL